MCEECHPPLLKWGKITKSGLATVEVIRDYLPSNYKVVNQNDTHVFIEGQDVGGWTLEEYVIPRLGSGLIACAPCTVGEAFPDDGENEP